MTQKIFTDWQPKHAALWGQHPLRLKHSLAESPLFSNSALAELISSYPREHYDLLHTAEVGAARREWREGEIGSASGEDVMDAVRDGRMWINLRRVMEVDARYDGVLKDIFAELSSRVPGFDPYKLNLGILISSPKAQVYYHADIPGQSLWQIRGTKRVYVYPTIETLLPKPTLEGIILGSTEEEFDYEPWYDDCAQVVDLEPGEMLHWPLNCPHRVENHDMLNVSLTTEHWTEELKRHYVVNYANGVMRHRFGLTPKGHDTTGLGYYAKLGLAGIWKVAGLQKSKEVKRTVDFRLNPQAADFMLDIPAYQR
ncbi:MAG: cupin-like domain-containing protein [Pseudomonadota bacterium]